MSIPHVIPNDLIPHLERQFPNKLPLVGSGATMDKIHVLQGQQTVIDYLKRIKEESDQNVYG